MTEEEHIALKAQLAKRCACEFEGDNVPRKQTRWCSLHEEMRKGYEKRIRELEEEKANLLLHVTDMRDWNNRASAHSEKMQAENKRLREFIQDAEHEGYCETDLTAGECDCWKSRALEGD